MDTATSDPELGRRRHAAVKRTCIALAVLAATIGGAAQADARPLDRGTFHDFGSEPFEFPPGTPICPGLDVTHSWDVRGSYVIQQDRRDGQVYIHDTARGSEWWTNNATGKSFRVEFTRNARDMSVVDNGDGTLSIIVQGSGGDRWYDGNGKLVLRDPGMVRFEVLIDHNGTPTDPFDDEFIAFVGVVKESTGRNDTAGRNFCEDIALFTS